MSNFENGTLYVGVTSDLVKRVWQHKNNVYKDSFTAKYNLHSLVYYEICEDINSAILREKQLKGGSRKKKLELINNFNSQWKDLYNSIL